jgi:hypothetical protein
VAWNHEKPSSLIGSNAAIIHILQRVVNNDASPAVTIGLRGTPLTAILPAVFFKDQKSKIKDQNKICTAFALGECCKTEYSFGRGKSNPKETTWLSVQ